MQHHRRGERCALGQERTVGQGIGEVVHVPLEVVERGPDIGAIGEQLRVAEGRQVEKSGGGEHRISIGWHGMGAEKARKILSLWWKNSNSSTEISSST